MVCCIITINLLLVFWFHLTGDILYHRNLSAKRSFFVFLDSYIFFREYLEPREDYQSWDLDERYLYEVVKSKADHFKGIFQE